MVSHEYKLTYFNCRGLGEPIRLMLIDNGIPFEDYKFAGADWPAIKPTMPFGQVPQFEDKVTGLKVCQTGAILRHIARKHDLYGASECEMVIADMFYEGVKDLHSKYAGMIYTQPFEKHVEARAEHVSKVAPSTLRQFEQLFSLNGGDAFILGQNTCFADYVLFEELAIHLKLDANCLKQLPLLAAFHARMAARPNLQPYLHSAERAKMAVNGIDRQ